MPGSNPGSWFQQGPGNASSSVGQVSEQPLTFTDDAAVTVTGASTALVAADAGATSRTVVISMKSTADVGVHISFGGTATTDMLFLGPGVYSFVTTQSIAAIRAGSSDVVVYLAVAEVA